MGLGIVWLAISFLLSSCGHVPQKNIPSDSSDVPANPSGRYQGKDNDWGPDKEIDMSHVPNATPRYESRTIAGNKNPYTILGKTYVLMKEERNYKERGIASWYGYKFNGEFTSNGEQYDMFSMTGAHKTLPIPSYVKVTNTDNHKWVIVRINDRGPFHDGRIIDLSYAAAQRIGITHMGTGNVEVEVVVPQDDPRPPLRAKSSVAAAPVALAPVHTEEAGTAASHDGTYLQIAAFGTEKAAKEMVARIKPKLNFPVVINLVKAPHKLYRVHVGPFKSDSAIVAAREQLQKINILQAVAVHP
jgi:rare lipoprotein A